MRYGMARNIRKRMPPTVTLYVYNVSISVCERFCHEMQGIGRSVLVDSPREAAASSSAMAIGVRSGCDRKLLHEIIHNSTGETFMADHVQPVPWVLPHAPSSNNYRLEFKTQMMIKNLSLGVQADYATSIHPSVAEAALRVSEKAAVDSQCIGSCILSSFGGRNHYVLTTEDYDVYLPFQTLPKGLRSILLDWL